MKPTCLRRSGFVFAVVAFVTVGPARPEDDWTWPEEPKNLQVFRKDWTGKRLAPIMTGFTRSLAVRCTYCHVGEEGKPLGTYDFVSDEKPNKERSREMYRMLGSINDHLKKIQPSGDKRVNMWCFTCHQGRPRPMTVGEELGETYRHSGIAPALARYRELRDKYDNRGAYDFGERSLNDFGKELLEQKDVEGAIAIWRQNAAEFPKSGRAWDSLADGYLAAGKKPLAQIYYRKSLEVDPQNESVLEKLRKLEEQPKP